LEENLVEIYIPMPLIIIWKVVECAVCTMKIPK
jgi:hypothetical protein